MGEEMVSLIRACAVVPAALGYCYVLPFWTSIGRRRLLAVLPVVVLFAVLPLSFRTIHLRGISAFFLSWLATFKLLLFSLGRGPLSPTGPIPPSSFLTFLAVAALPIKVRRKQPPPQPQPPRARGAPRPLLTLLGFAAKGFLLAFIVSVYPHRRRLHRGLVLGLYCVHMYLSLDMVLAAAAAAGRALLPAGTELAPQFAAPYLSSSLQDFWGRRWNLMVSDILRSAVYAPVRAAWGSTTGVMAAFLVSGLMHEIMFYYLTMKPPTGEVGFFFALHGACMAAEITAKRWWARRGMGGPLNLAVAAPLTIGFLVATGIWLFFPQITRSGAEEAVVSEAEALVGLLWGAGGRAR
ncbi:hypothetical protein Taro_037156 [Colocasia esculenta]|uniref:Wax synthase domain-containing protein n=1 Tax=Colocasia esculenta TaxID=4460 RepID=A0A843W3E7_COLES|nr:hypothetical protein [Colocasia esculenta]